MLPRINIFNLTIAILLALTLVLGAQTNYVVSEFLRNQGSPTVEATPGETGDGPISQPSDDASPSFALPSNLSEIEAIYPLSEENKAALRAKGFVVLHNVDVERLSEAYFGLFNEERIAVFISSDVALHLFHNVFDDLLAELEKGQLYDDVDWLVQQVYTASVTSYAATSDTHPLSKAAARHNVLVFAVAARLLDDSFVPPDYVEPDASQYVQKILDHTATEFYPGDDYTQYEPRGHYAGEERLERYFHTVKWLSRRIFRIEDNVYPDEADVELTAAALLAQVINANPDIKARWSRVYDVTRLLASSADSITPPMVQQALDNVFGSGFTLTMLEGEANRTALRTEFTRDIYPTSEIIPVPLAFPDQIPPKYVQFLGERYAPDAEAMQKTVFPHVPTRFLPSGLDVMATVLGSDRAKYWLGDDIATHSDLDTQIDILRAQFDAYTETTWTKSTYNGWLYSLRPLLQPMSPNAPPFMQGAAWQDKELNAALGSWTQLRHDFILYGKQTYIPAPYAEGPGMTEPVPDTFGRLADLCNQVYAILAGYDTLPATHSHSLQELDHKLRTWQAYAQKVAAGDWLTEEEQQDIHSVGLWLLGFYQGNQGVVEKSAMLVADVASDSNTGSVLHEGTGHFNPLIVTYIPPGGEPLGGVGYVFSHYEFVESDWNRLSDAEWETKLREDPPRRPPWAFSSSSPLHVCPSGCDYASVQHAVDAANDGDVINVAAGTYTGVNVRARKDITTTGVVTQMLYIDKSITIRGGYTTTDGSTLTFAPFPTTLDAQGQGRGIYITGDIKVTLENLRITGGDAAGMGGGPGGENAGGGLYGITATVTLRNSYVVNNVTPHYGGGIYNAGTLLLDHSSSSNNATHHTCDDCINTACPVSHGGGVYNHGTLALKDSTVNDNTTSDGCLAYIGGYPGGSGGGLYNTGVLTLNHSTVDGNSTGDGAIASGMPSHGGAGGTGGGIYNRGALAVISSTVSNNVTGNGGPGSEDSESRGGPGGNGGGIYNSGALMVISSTLNHNVTGAGGESSGDFLSQDGREGDGGGIYSSSRLKVISSTLSNNITGAATEALMRFGPLGSGGGIAQFGSTGIMLSGNTIDSNTAHDEGGGVYGYQSDSITLSHNLVLNNRAGGVADGGGAGGGIYIKDSDNIVLRDNVIHSNGAYGVGGLSLGNGKVTLTGNAITDNSAVFQGGIHLVSKEARVSNNTILSNTAIYWGGLSLIHGHVMLFNNVIAGNFSVTEGGGLSVTSVTLRGLYNTIARNTGENESGIHITNDSTVALTNTILASHKVAINMTQGNTLTLNGILWFNTPVTITHAPTTSVAVYNQHGGDPAFAIDGYHIMSTSAAIDAGVAAGITTDLDGDARPLGDAPDLGADEYTAVETQPALSIFKTDNPDPVQMGERLTYTIVVENTGNADATAVTITDTLPVDTAFARADAGGSLVNDQMHWADKTIRANSSLTVSFTVSVTSSLSNSTMITNAHYRATCTEGISAVGAPVTTTITTPGSPRQVYLPLILRIR